MIIFGQDFVDRYETIEEAVTTALWKAVNKDGQKNNTVHINQYCGLKMRETDENRAWMREHKTFVNFGLSGEDCIVLFDIYDVVDDAIRKQKETKMEKKLVSKARDIARNGVVFKFDDGNEAFVHASEWSEAMVSPEAHGSLRNDDGTINTAFGPKTQEEINQAFQALEGPSKCPLSLMGRRKPDKIVAKIPLASGRTLEIEGVKEDLQHMFTRDYVATEEILAHDPVSISLKAEKGETTKDLADELMEKTDIRGWVLEKYTHSAVAGKPEMVWLRSTSMLHKNEDTFMLISINNKQKIKTIAELNRVDAMVACRVLETLKHQDRQEAIERLRQLSDYGSKKMRIVLEVKEPKSDDFSLFAEQPEYVTVERDSDLLRALLGMLESKIEGETLELLREELDS